MFVSLACTDIKIYQPYNAVLVTSLDLDFTALFSQIDIGNCLHLFKHKIKADESIIFMM